MSTWLSLQLLIGFLLGALIGFGARRARALSNSGAWAATLIGGVIFGLGGLPWAVLLLLFFFSSSILSRAFKRRKAGVDEKYSKGSQRDWGQVFANGGLGALLALGITAWPEQNWPWIAYLGATAAVNADTWATEIGVLSSSMPRLITTGRRVEKGTSGGISSLGILASLAGAGVIGAAAGSFQLDLFLALLAVGATSGLVGSLFDSLIGATVQAIYHCPVCQKETERYPVHTCGAVTRQMRGWHWVNNDVVNFFCSLVGALAAIGLWTWLV